MIRRLRGKLVESTPGRAVVMTAAGVGYELQVPTTLYDRLPDSGEDVELECALVVRDDALELFGFRSGRERELFLRLQNASGVGPRLALALLGTLAPPRLVEAIRAKDHEVLQMVSGVGKKTAERIAVELADKLDDLAAPDEAGVPAGTEASSAVQALVSLGYSRMESEKAVNRARQERDGEGDDTESLIRAALTHL